MCRWIVLSGQSLPCHHHEPVLIVVSIFTAHGLQEYLTSVCAMALVTLKMMSCP